MNYKYYWSNALLVNMIIQFMNWCWDGSVHKESIDTAFGATRAGDGGVSGNLILELTQ